MRTDLVIEPTNSSIQLVAQALEQGLLVVIPTDTVYGLAAKPTASAVAKLFQAKGRPETRPIPLLVADELSLPAVVAHWPHTAAVLAQAFWPGALTIIVQAQPELPTVITADTGTVGVRIPANDVAREVIHRAGGYLAVTSANRSEEPPALTAQVAAQTLGAHVAYVLDGGPTVGGVPSTVVVAEEHRVVIRRTGAVSFDSLQQTLNSGAPGTTLLLCEDI